MPGWGKKGRQFIRDSFCLMFMTFEPDLNPLIIIFTDSYFHFIVSPKHTLVSEDLLG